MNPARSALRWMTLAAALGAAVAALPAQDEPIPAAPATDVRAETLRILAAEARRAPAPAAPSGATAAAAPGAPAPVVMAPYILRETKVPRALDPVPETRFQRFQEDGTLFHLVGPHVTTNIFLHFYRVPAMEGSTSQPGSGVQLGVGFSW